MAPSSSASPTAQWASFYARAGIRTFPIWAGEKRPMFAGWQKDATTDPDQIERYFRSDPNIGAICGDVFDAWDIEVEHLPAFTGWLEKTGNRLPEAPIASTGRGGLHILTAPTGVDGTRYLYLDGVHIGELKSTGGFILVCPSETERMYRWTYLPDRMAVKPAPDWLLGLLERPKTTVHRFKARLASPEDVVEALGRLAASVQRAPQGSRNNYLYWAVRRAIEEGVPANHAQRVLKVAATESGLDAEEIEKTIESALEAESVAA